mmetsp:Transcript_127913/g.368495  ORF Transcript_127913/g.368495 Transcript_127913/m.368495 type:complete len:310 (+) Transcript_127913:709-1638(+)
MEGQAHGAGDDRDVQRDELELEVPLQGPPRDVRLQLEPLVLRRQELYAIGQQGLQHEEGDHGQIVPQEGVHDHADLRRGPPRVLQLLGVLKRGPDLQGADRDRPKDQSEDEPAVREQRPRSPLIVRHGGVPPDDVGRLGSRAGRPAAAVRQDELLRDDAVGDGVQCHEGRGGAGLPDGQVLHELGGLQCPLHNKAPAELNGGLQRGLQRLEAHGAARVRPAALGPLRAGPVVHALVRVVGVHLLQGHVRRIRALLGLGLRVVLGAFAGKLLCTRRQPGGHRLRGRVKLQHLAQLHHRGEARAPQQRSGV